MPLEASKTVSYGMCPGFRKGTINGLKILNIQHFTFHSCFSTVHLFTAL